MCGRYAQRKPEGEPWRRLAPGYEPGPPRYNIAPGTDCLVIRTGEPAPEGAWLRWNFTPGWLRDPSRAQINARAETAAEKPMFRDAFRSRRCLVPADGWYEWQPQGDRKQPVFFQFREAEPFAFGGIWTGDTFAILTTVPSTLAAAVHGRMPVLIRPHDYAEWLDPGHRGTGRLQFLCRTWEDAPLEAWPVSTVVNRPQHDGPACVEPAGPPIKAQGA